MGGDILFLAHRLPFPPDRGDRIRSHHILKALARIAPVHVGCFIDSEADRVHTQELARTAASWCVVQRSKPLPVAGVQALWRNEPVSLTAFASPALARWVENLLASGKIAAVYVFSGQMGQFVPASWAGPLVADLVDVDSAKFEAYADEARFPKNWLNAREGRLLCGVEAKLAARADHTLLVSEAEAQLLRSRAPNASNISALCNGIDAGFFCPDGIAAAPQMAGEGPHFLFTGQMDYQPNVAAVRRMALSILPLIRAHLGRAKFHIAGRCPSAEVRALADEPGCIVHGEVPDMRPYLAAADMVIAPLVIARGVQNKVLEAMAMARPTLVSPQAATGIGAIDGKHLAIADSDAELAASAISILREPLRAQAMGKAARQFVIEKQSWPAMLERLPHIMGMAKLPVDAGTKGQTDAA